jgi:hypothetical protein
MCFYEDKFEKEKHKIKGKSGQIDKIKNLI